MSTTEYRLNELLKLFNRFEAINTKADNQYSFEMTRLPSNNCVEKEAEAHINQWFPTALVSCKPVVDWREYLTQMFEVWLFDNMPNCDQSFISGDDVLSAKMLCDKLDDILEISKAIEINTVTDKWYEAHWQDVVLQGTNDAVFIHFGVSD